MHRKKEGRDDLQRRVIVWLDSSGSQRQTYLTGSGSPVATLTDLGNLSNAALFGYYEGVLINTAAGPPTYGVYPSVADMLWMDCRDTFGDDWRLYLPAPKLTNFLPDEQTLDLTAAAIATLQATMIAENVANPSTGRNFITIVAGGLLRRGRSVRDDLTWSSAFPMLRRQFIWSDSQGNTTSTTITGTTSMPLTSPVLEAASNAEITSFWEGNLVHIGGSTTPGAYPAVMDSAFFVCHDDRGSETRIILPSPQRGIFLADGVTVNMQDPAVMNLVTDMVAELVVPSSGRLVQGVRGGWYSHPRQLGIR